MRGTKARGARLFPPAPLAGFLGLAAMIGFATAKEETASRKLLFFDLWKLDDWHHVDLRIGEPQWIPEATWTDPTAPTSGVHFPTVWQDEDSGAWRMIYSLKWSPFTLMAAQSDDGRNWEPLPVPDANPKGGKIAPHHLFTLPRGAGGTAYRDPLATDGYRFRIFGRQHADREAKRYENRAVTLVSRDGLHWELKTGAHWDWGLPGWHPEPPVFGFWNEDTGMHGMTVRPGWGDRRQCLRQALPGFQHWTLPRLVFQPDPLDLGGPIGMYGLPVHPVGNGAGYIGLLWIFHNASSEPVNSFNQFFGTMDAQLVYSYDGSHFVRGPRQAFLELNPIPEHGCTQIRPCSIVETDTEVRFYSEGHRGEHGRETAEQKRRKDDTPLGSLLLHTLRKDGWMFLQSRGDWGRFQTKPLVIWTPEIRLNAAATFGEVRFQITDEKSQPIEGLTFDDCLPLKTDDQVEFALQWKDADLNRVVGKAIRIEVKFRNARIYAFDMAHHFIDAQDLWRLKDDLPIDQRLFNF